MKVSEVKSAIVKFHDSNPSVFWGIVGFLAGFLTCWVL